MFNFNKSALGNLVTDTHNLRVRRSPDNIDAPLVYAEGNQMDNETLATDQAS
jgi:hypothetical protein